MVSMAAAAGKHFPPAGPASPPRVSSSDVNNLDRFLHPRPRGRGSEALNIKPKPFFSQQAASRPRAPLCPARRTRASSWSSPSCPCTGLARPKGPHSSPPPSHILEVTGQERQRLPNMCTHRHLDVHRRQQARPRPPACLTARPGTYLRQPRAAAPGPEAATPTSGNAGAAPGHAGKCSPGQRSRAAGPGCRSRPEGGAHRHLSRAWHWGGAPAGK